MIGIKSANRLELGLCLLRYGVAAVMIPWAIDKIVLPAHAARIFENFYLISGLNGLIFAVLGIAQLVIVLGFLVGFAKTWTYGAVLLMHAVSTFASWQKYLNFDLLFFAAWPMLAACIMLFMMRDEDRMLTIDRHMGP